MNAAVARILLARMAILEASKPAEVEKVKPVRQEVAAGRNALCPCGSGKKYKRCCRPGSAAAETR